MSKYNILRWDAVLAKNGINKIPMIYIQPDTSFLQFIKNNNWDYENCKFKMYYQEKMYLHDCPAG